MTEHEDCGCGMGDQCQYDDLPRTTGVEMDFPELFDLEPFAHRWVPSEGDETLLAAMLLINNPDSTIIHTSYRQRDAENELQRLARIHPLTDEEQANMQVYPILARTMGTINEDIVEMLRRKAVFADVLHEVMQECTECEHGHPLYEPCFGPERGDFDQLMFLREDGTRR